MHCYEDLIRRKPTAEGKVVISFTITTDGKAKNAHVANTTFVSHDVAFCVAKIIGRLTFEKPKGGEVIVKKTFVFEVGDKNGKIKRRNQLKKWLKTHQPDVNYCIVQNSKKTIPTGGKLVVRASLKDKKLRFIEQVWSSKVPRGRQMHYVRNEKMGAVERN